MLSSIVVRLVMFSHRCAWAVVLMALILSGILGAYVSAHFKINTDTNQLLASDLDWRKQEAQLEQAFLQKKDLLLVVVDGDTPALAETAADTLAQQLTEHPQQFNRVIRPEKIPFFQKNGLLFLSKDELNNTLNQIISAQPLLGHLAGDLTLRGFWGMIKLMLQGVQQGEIDYISISAPLAAIASTVEASLAGQNQPLQWQSPNAEQTPQLSERRKFIITQPVLNYADLSPGASASTTLRTLASQMQLTPEHGIHVRLTGSVALNDEEFASVASGTRLALLLSGTLVLIILLMALRSLRLVIPILLTLITGLITTTAFALATVGSLNLISVAFAVMFIGIAVDFGIQFGVRYRDQHFLQPNHQLALKQTAQNIAIPLSMAAGATALGFLAFIPTAYRGVSELGMIAGAGMLIAYFLNITLLPAWLALTHPPAEPEAVGYRWAAPADVLINKHPIKIVILAISTAFISTAITTQIRFDFDPLNLKDPQTESVTTLLDILQDPNSNAYALSVLTPNLSAAQQLGEALQKLSQVDHVMSLASFIPADQPAKLQLISEANDIFAPSFSASTPAPPPQDAEILAVITTLITDLKSLPNQPVSALRLANALKGVAEQGDHVLLQRLHHNLVTVMANQLEAIKLSLSAETITAENITNDLRQDWITPQGQALLEIYPKGNPRQYQTLIAFTQVVKQIAPNATGTPVVIQASAQTITQAFIQAGIYALVAIALLAYCLLRRWLDVVLLLTPLLVAGLMTLATLVLIDLPINFANIIAFPLLLSLGVSYALYFVFYTRAGLINPLQSSMARAVLYSAATALVAFGSLALSTHPGTSSMGKLLIIALLYALLTSFILLPAMLKISKK